MLVLIINFFSLNFKSIEIEGERVSSSQNERPLWGVGGEGGGRVLKNEHGQTRGEKGGGVSKLENLEQTYFLDVPY